jgi:hypothetical protein
MSQGIWALAADARDRIRSKAAGFRKFIFALCQLSPGIVVVV